MLAQKKRLVTCPNCRQTAEYSLQNTYRPFCSERCKLIDLGLWANEEYTIATPIDPNTFDDQTLD